ncbi:hypothetical protein Igag_1685 [Ignisphaera aggregans DSM 17230]|uniref:Uncharacterized protein n=1 Tax=Ignisphaera aggregans (strain DSM 17230 / JCM 13409 / AQ1.S1) TaxID=583356 RepID=E0SRV1_IGNAA|nr:hypothetical protein Igag_1685 [Ignisphaera aggregans DSM 17230]
MLGKIYIRLYRMFFLGVLNMVSIIWSVSSNPSRYRDGVSGICLLGDNIYVVGFSEPVSLGVQRYRVESRRKSDGSIINSWISDESYRYGSLYSCIAMGSRIYVAGASIGFWDLYEFSPELGLIDHRRFEESFIPFSMASNGRDIYIAGTYIGEVYEARVIRISTPGLEISAIYRSLSKPSSFYGVVYSESSKRVVVGGYDSADGFQKWRIEFLSPELEVERVIRPDVRGCITGVSVGIDGDIYVVGRMGVMRLSGGGRIIAENRRIGGIEIYTPKTLGTSLGDNIAVIDHNTIHILDRNNLETRETIRIARGLEIIAFPYNSPVYDGTYLYVAGTESSSPENWNWIIMAIDPRPRRIPIRMPRIRI